MQTHLLAQEITDFNGTSRVLNDAVDGEMGIYKTHLVPEALRDSDDEVVNEGSNGAQACIVLSSTLPDLQEDLVPLLRRDVHGDMSNILLQRPPRARHGNDARLDLDFDPLRHFELFDLDDIFHGGLRI